MSSNLGLWNNPTIPDSLVMKFAPKLASDWPHALHIDFCCVQVHWDYWGEEEGGGYMRGILGLHPSGTVFLRVNPNLPEPQNAQTVPSLSY